MARNQESQAGLDAAAFLRRMQTSASPVEWAERVCGFKADAKQRELLEGDWHRVILNCCRQWGKSTVAALVAAYWAVHKPGALVLLGSPSERQSKELLRKARGHLERAGVKLCGGGQDVSFGLAENGSRVVGLSKAEDTARGFSGVSMLILDEASRVKDSFYQAVRPMLAASNGSLWLLSTPFYQQGFFYKTWRDGAAAEGKGWRRVKVTALDNPRITKEFLREEQRTHPEDWFRQEYFGDFLEHPNRVFTYDMIDACFSDEIEPILFPGQKKPTQVISMDRVREARARLKAREERILAGLPPEEELPPIVDDDAGKDAAGGGEGEATPTTAATDGKDAAGGGGEGEAAPTTAATDGNDAAGGGGEVEATPTTAATDGNDAAGGGGEVEATPTTAATGGNDTKPESQTEEPITNDWDGPLRRRPVEERAGKGSGLRMPDAEKSGGGPIRWEGSVLEGKIPVERALERERLERILRGEPEPGQRGRRPRGPLW